MRKSLFQFTIFPFILLLFLTFSCDQQGVKVDEKSDIAAIEDVASQYGVALNTGDLDLWISLWTDDGIQMAPNAPAVFGKEQLRAKNENIFAKFNFKAVITNKEVKIAGDMAFIRGTYTLSLTPKIGGETIMIDGKYLDILERQADGSWKISRDCYNDNTPLNEIVREGTAG